MSRPQTPYTIAEATGAVEHNKGRYQERKKAPQPTGPLGDPPTYFDDTQRDLWREIAEVTAPGVLTSADRILVEITARLLSRFRSFDPEEALSAVELGHLRACLGSMGLTPADRGRVTGSNVPQEKEDPADRFLARRGLGKAN